MHTPSTRLLTATTAPIRSYEEKQRKPVWAGELLLAAHYQKCQGYAM